jgi:hypothetical protein
MSDDGEVFEDVLVEDDGDVFEDVLVEYDGDVLEDDGDVFEFECSAPRRAASPTVTVREATFGDFASVLAKCISMVKVVRTYIPAGGQYKRYSLDDIALKEGLTYGPLLCFNYHLR